MTIWFTSDWHLGHKNIFNFSRRERKIVFQNNFCSKLQVGFSIEEKLDMMQLRYFTITKKAVEPEDEIYFLGDMTFTGEARQDFLQFVDSLDCVKKVLVSGNHDKTWKKHNEKETAVFDEVYIRGEHILIDIVEDSGQHFVLSHLPNRDYGDKRDWSVPVTRDAAGDVCSTGTLRPTVGPNICGHVHDKWRVWHQPQQQKYDPSSGASIFDQEVWQFNCGVDANNHQLVSGETIFNEWERRYVKK